MSELTGSVLTEEEIAELEGLERSKTNKVRETDKLDPAQFMKDTRINPNDLDTAMLTQAGLFAHYAVVAAKTQERAENLKLKREVLESKIDQEIRDRAATDGTKLTEKMIEAEIHRDVRWVQVQKSLNAVRAEADLAKSALEALRHKRDMMVQLGVNQREEMKGAVRVKTAEVESAASAASSEAIRKRALEIASAQA